MATVAPGVDGAAAIQMNGNEGSYAVSLPSVSATSSVVNPYSSDIGKVSYSTISAPATSSTHGPITSGNLIYDYYSVSAPACKAKYTGADGKITKVFTEVDGTTLLEIYDQPTQSVGGGGGNGPGGQWLEAVPLSHQQKKACCCFHVIWVQATDCAEAGHQISCRMVLNFLTLGQLTTHERKRYCHKLGF
jgi:hypothetical protein